MNPPIASTFPYDRGDGACTDAYLWPKVESIVSGELAAGSRVFDLGCGNGALARRLGALGYDVHGVDPSEQGIAFARAQDPDTKLSRGSAYDPLREQYGTFPVVVSLEVVEHVYHPRRFAACVAELLEPGGLAIVSTPYHGYWKNLALALAGKWDGHFTALWDHGHIKFWSVQTLSELFREARLERESLHRVGRLPAFAK